MMCIIMVIFCGFSGIRFSQENHPKYPNFKEVGSCLVEENL